MTLAHAASSTMAGKINKAVEKEVTCPLCLDLFKEPKKLPCDHVYCKDCLKGLALCSLGGSISCPECRNITELQNDDVNNFPTAFRVNRLVEAFQEAREETDCHRQESTDILTQMCTTHKAQPLALYCETCKAMLCRDCVIMTKEHVCHDYDYMEKIVKNLCDKHEKGLLMAKEYERLLSQVRSQISEVEHTIASEETANLEEIDSAFDSLHKTLEENKQTMKRQLSKVYQSALDNLILHKRDIERVQAETAHVTALVEGAFAGKNEALLRQKELIETNLKRLRKQIATQQIPQIVDERSLPLPEVMSSETLQKYLDSCNFLYTPADPKKCYIEGSLMKKEDMGKGHVLVLNLVDSDGKKCLRGSHKVKVELRSTRDNTTTTGTIQPHCQGSVSIGFESPKRGRNEINVTVRGIHVSNSPQSTYLHIPPSQLGKPIAQIRNLGEPAGLTRWGSDVLAVEYSHNRILKFNTGLEVVAEYGQEILRGPAELTIDQYMNIYVSTVKDHRVHKFTSQGKYIKSTGSKGTLPGQFDFPNGLRINSQEELYVCDSRNNRLQVFNLQLSYKQVFGRPGNEPGQFLFPSDVDFDCNDNIYVCDNYNHRVQVFSPNKCFLYTIGHKLFGLRKELTHPVNLRVVNDQVFVTQNHHITVFKTSGEVKATFGKGVLSQPEGIEVDVDGYVYVSSHCSKIIIF